MTDYLHLVPEKLPKINPEVAQRSKRRVLQERSPPAVSDQTAPGPSSPELSKEVNYESSKDSHSLDLECDTLALILQMDSFDSGVELKPVPEFVIAAINRL